MKIREVMNHNITSVHLGTTMREAAEILSHSWASELMVLDHNDEFVGVLAEGDIGFILPAHGHVLGFAPQAIAQLKAHRLKREARIVAAMQARPDGSIDDWVRIAYDDVPERLWPVAARSLLAHVERIRSLSLAG